MCVISLCTLCLSISDNKLIIESHFMTNWRSKLWNPFFLGHHFYHFFHQSVHDISGQCQITHSLTFSDTFQCVGSVWCQLLYCFFYPPCNVTTCYGSLYKNSQSKKKIASCWHMSLILYCVCPSYVKDC